MGVHGLIPFLRKTCPEVFHTLPNRFKELSGKHVVIDGTLITQRFHFSPSNHPYRHVLGWYRIAEEMRRSGVAATCVFDGTARHTAKMRELLRRKETQKLTAVRGHIEAGRLERLARLKTNIANVSSLPPASVTEALETLKKLCVTDSKNSAVQDALKTLDSQASDRALSEVSWEVPADPSNIPGALPVTPTDATQTLALLYQDFQKSLPELATMVNADATPPPSDTPDRKLDDVMSKAQARLAVKEKEFWDQICSTHSDDPEAWKMLDMLSRSLVDQSYAMSNSFSRRANLPTKATYQQSREVLSAMGVRCIYAEGDVEGEGLASALTLGGQADFVASEDTDVLVYGAPLMRNLANNHAPLEILSAETIRKALDLDRKAYIDFALLLGTDFSQRIKNVGPKRALQFIREYGTIEEVLQSEPKYPPRGSREEYLAEVNAARSIFSTLPPVSDLGRLGTQVHSDEAVAEVLKRYHLQQASDDSGWGDLTLDLSSGYFNDNPTAV